MKNLVLRTVKVLCASLVTFNCAFGADDLFISEPADGGVVTGNATGNFNIVVRQRPSLERFYFNQMIVVIADRGLQISEIQTADPYTFVGRLPENAAGTYHLTAYGVRKGGSTVESKTVSFSVATPTVVSIQPTAKLLSIGYPGDTGADISILGTTQFGTKIAIPKSQVTYTVQNSAIVVVRDGVPIGKLTGTTDVVLDYQGLSSSIKIEVGALTRKGDFNNDGQVDSRDVDLLKTYLNTTAISTDDARDLNKDGKIDALDLRILTTLCARPRCAKQ